MDLKFQVTASGRTDAELLNVIETREKYLPETIEASVAELQHRGHTFNEEELEVIAQDVQAHRVNAEIGGQRSGLITSNYKNNLVEDPDAPLFYSRRVIYIFAFIFSPLFGSIMLAMNVNKTDKPARMAWVILFGVAYTAFQIVLGQSLHTSSSVSIVTSLAGAYVLESFFWNRFIGNATFYRARPFWVPLIIAVVLSVLVILAMIYALAQ